MVGPLYRIAYWWDLEMFYYINSAGAPATVPLGACPGAELPSDRLRRSFDAQSCWHRRTEDVVVRLMLPVRSSEAETATLDACCAVQAEVVVKIRQTASCDRCWAAASRILASLGPVAKLLGRGPITMNCRSPPYDLAKSPRRHSSAGLTVSTATCSLTGRQMRCEATQLTDIPDLTFSHGATVSHTLR